MSSKRKSDSHSRGTSRPLTMKSGGFQVDSERDSGFSGGAQVTSPVQVFMLWYYLVRKAKQIFLQHNFTLNNS